MWKTKITLLWTGIIISSQGFCYPSLFNNRSKTVNVQEHLSLDGLLYGGPSHWILWMNGKKVTPHHKYQLQKIVIKKVTPNEVTFSWGLPGTKQQKYVTLRPGETFYIYDEDSAEEEPYAATSTSSLEDELIIPNADK